MLTGLSIRDIVLIDRLDIEFSDGLCALTGETGAGKSIILDSLGLAIGSRADRALIRQGQETGSVTAAFEISERFLQSFDESGELGIDALEPLILKRVITKDGRTKAYVNDAPVAVATLSKIGDALLEIHGQHGDRFLMDVGAHRALLDSYGNLNGLVHDVQEAYDAVKHAEQALREHEQVVKALNKEKDYLLHARDELGQLDPQTNEEHELADRRAFMMQAENVHAEIAAVRSKLADENGLEREIYGVLRQVGAIKVEGSDSLEKAVDLLENASDAVARANQYIDLLVRELEFDPAELETTEERLFALRAAARKHKVSVDQLPALLEKFQTQLETLHHDEQVLDQLRGDVDKARQQLSERAAKLTKKRASAAKKLDAALKKELPPLKLEKARFETCLQHHSGETIGRNGAESVEFHAATNPNTEMGPIGKVASGGELARFSLALKVVLRRAAEQKTLIFDEVDQGIGGAVADAVGERLHDLAKEGQVLVITHSPQVAARAKHHWRIRKDGSSKSAKQVLTRVEDLNAGERREEIARMLAGASVTDEARAAADQLLRHQ